MLAWSVITPDLLPELITFRLEVPESLFIKHPKFRLRIPGNSDTRVRRCAPKKVQYCSEKVQYCSDPGQMAIICKGTPDFPENKRVALDHRRERFTSNDSPYDG
ncbi:MAG: hypothetical protein JWP57_1918 [Spirosoma sp.]|nr:hypothetical protein [Spirosoma sp.]